MQIENHRWDFFSYRMNVMNGNWSVWNFSKALSIAMDQSSQGLRRIGIFYCMVGAAQYRNREVFRCSNNRCDAIYRRFLIVSATLWPNNWWTVRQFRPTTSKTKSVPKNYFVTMFVSMLLFQSIFIIENWSCSGTVILHHNLLMCPSLNI